MRFFRDFDIAVVVDKMPRRDVVRKVYDEIYQSIGLPNPEGDLYRFSRFVVDIKFLRRHDLVYPDIWFYDLKVASKLVYGEDVRQMIPTDKMNIPLTSGLRVLFEKVCGLLGTLSYGDLRNDRISEERREVLVFECYKTFIEICTALCILSGTYDAWYSSRASSLQGIYGEEFPDIAQVLPDLPERVRKYTDFKLKPEFDKVQDDPVGLWFDARAALGTVLQSYLEKYSGLKSRDWDDLPRQMKVVSRSYYKPFLSSLMLSRFGSSNETMLDVASFLFQGLTNVEYTYAISRGFGRPCLNPLGDLGVSPSLKFFPAGIAILFSVNKDGTIQEKLLEKGINQLRGCVPVGISRLDGIGWETVRERFLKAYNLYRGYHFVK
jgi:hypothetical protein